VDASAAGTPTPAGANVPSKVSYDESRGRVVVWFSAPTLGGAELWAWTVATRTWARLSPARWPTLWPAADDEAGAYESAVYDAGRGRLVWFSSDSDIDVEALEWDGQSPTFSDPRPPTVGAWPSHLYDISAVYDRDDARSYVFGVRDQRDPQLWEWHGDTGSWVDRTNADDPTRAAPDVGGTSSMAYDARRGRLVLWAHPFSTTTFVVSEWDPATGLWEQRDVPANVLARAKEGGVAVYDEARGRVVLVWPGPAIAEWDGASWTLPTVPTPATPVATVLATYDPRRGRVVVLEGGAKLASWDGQHLVDETPASFAAVAADIQTPAAGLVYDWTRGNLVLMGERAANLLPNSALGLGVWTGSATPPP